MSLPEIHPALPFVEPALPGEAQRSEGDRGGIENRFDVPFVAHLALKEKQIQQNVRPVIAVHKWFARRPGTLFRALLLAEWGGEPLAESFHRPHQLSGVRVADPFMGGGHRSSRRTGWVATSRDGMSTRWPGGSFVRS